MTKIARMTPTIPRGTIIGKRTGGPPLNEAEHFHKCEACGGWFEHARSRRGARPRGTAAASGARSGAISANKKSGPGFPRPDPIFRAAYIRPRCHLDLYFHGHRRCQITKLAARPA